MKKSIFILFAIAGLVFSSINCANGDTLSVAPGTIVTIGEFVFEDDYSPSTADCTVTVYDPSGNIIVNAITMSEQANGWHYYSYELASDATDGLWPSFMQCGSSANGDLIKVTKSFKVDSSLLSASSSLGARITASQNVSQQLIEAASSSLSSRIASEVSLNRSMISALNNITASDVWAYAASTDYSTSTFSQIIANKVWNTVASGMTQSGTIGKLVADNLDARVSAIPTATPITAADVWNSSNRTLSDYAVSPIAQAVWNNSTRTLTSYGNDITAADVWNTVSSGLTSVGSIGKLISDNLNTAVSTRASSAELGGWKVSMSNSSSVQTGSTYRAKIFISSQNGTPTNPSSAPAVTLYDSVRNTIVSGASATKISTGVYEYTYIIPGTAAQGVWETSITTEVESGTSISNSDYWNVVGSPAQVIINSVNASAPSGDSMNVSANLTVTNEGLAGYEYQYEWCVVSSEDNACGGGNDTYRGTGAKFINPGEDWNTTLSAKVSTPGNYYFKVVVYFGNEKSGSSRTFEVPQPSTNPGGNTGGNSGGSNSSSGGGGGSSSSMPFPSVVMATSTASWASSDLNQDGKVGSVDFSILMAYWKTKPPFKNQRADINNDGKVDSVDFSILLSRWGKTL